MKRPPSPAAEETMGGGPTTSFFRDKHKLLVLYTGTVCFISAERGPSGRPAPFVPWRIWRYWGVSDWKEGKMLGLASKPGDPETGSPGVGRTQCISSSSLPRPPPLVPCLHPTLQYHHDTVIIMTVVIKSVIIATNISWTLSMKLALC